MKIRGSCRTSVSKLQHVQNCFAHMVLRAPRFSPSLHLLKHLHWLPLKTESNSNCPLWHRPIALLQYINHLSRLGSCTVRTPPINSGHLSSTSQQLYIPSTKLNLDKRAFSVIAPDIWNELPRTLKYCGSITPFSKNLKKYFSKWLFHRRSLKLIMVLMNVINYSVLMCFWSMVPRGIERYVS